MGWRGKSIFNLPGFKFSENVSGRETVSGHGADLFRKGGGEVVVQVTFKDAEKPVKGGECFAVCGHGVIELVVLQSPRLFPVAWCRYRPKIKTRNTFFIFLHFFPFYLGTDKKTGDLYSYNITRIKNVYLSICR